MDEDIRIIEVNGYSEPVTMQWLEDPTLHLLDKPAVNGQSSGVEEDGKVPSESESSDEKNERIIEANVRNERATISWLEDPTSHLLDIPAVNADEKREKPAFIGSARAKAQYEAILAKGE